MWGVKRVEEEATEIMQLMELSQLSHSTRYFQRGAKMEKGNSLFSLSFVKPHDFMSSLRDHLRATVAILTYVLCVDYRTEIPGMT